MIHHPRLGMFRDVWGRLGTYYFTFVLVYLYNFVFLYLLLYFCTFVLLFFCNFVLLYFCNFLPLYCFTFRLFYCLLSTVYCRLSTVYCLLSTVQTWKMLEMLPKQDCSFPDYTPKCVNYVNLKIVVNFITNTMFTTFTFLYHVY